jgi:hypothetical protein
MTELYSAPLADSISSLIVTQVLVIRYLSLIGYYISLAARNSIAHTRHSKLPVLLLRPQMLPCLTLRPYGVTIVTPYIGIMNNSRILDLELISHTRAISILYEASHHEASSNYSRNLFVYITPRKIITYIMKDTLMIQKNISPKRKKKISSLTPAMPY